MKALVVGYGSIGKRHSDILTALGLQVAVVSRREQSNQRWFSDLTIALEEWNSEYVVVASRTSEHVTDMEILAESGYDGLLLIEKPLFNTEAQPPAMLPQQTYIAYNLRFHPVIAALRSALRGVSAFAVNAHVGQYLPHWRPGTDYRVGYSAKRHQGGGALRDLSHEIDLINWLFGPWEQLTADGGKFSDLEIDTDDVFSLILKLKRCPHATISMNYLDTSATRQIFVQTSGGTMRTDLITGTFEVDGKRQTFPMDRNDTFIAQHKAVLNGQLENLCSLNEGIAAMDIILLAERACRERVWMQNR